MKTIQQILSFQESFSDYESVGNSAFVDRGNVDLRSIRQIKAIDINVNKEGIYINIDNRMSSFIKNRLSPEIKAKEGDTLVDTNKLLLSLCLTKVFFEEKEENIYFPLLSVDLTDKKREIFNAINNGVYQLKLDWSTYIVINEHVMKTFYDITYESNGEEFEEFIADEIGDLVPMNARDSLKDTLTCLYKPFKKSKRTELELMYPEYNKDNSAIFMFFNQKNEVKLRRAFDKIKSNPSELLIEYLSYKQEKNKQPEIIEKEKSFWFGSLTKEYPLGYGQGLVMQRNHMEDKIIPVIGGPGTGKTTLFLSLIASEVTKRTLSIINGEDYNNLTLVTSTANKAIDNISSDLRKGFKHGFCYVGGNQENKAKSAQEVLSYINFLKNKYYSKRKQNVEKEKIERIVSTLIQKESIFNEIKGFNLNLKNFKEFQEEIQNFKKKESSFSIANESFLASLNFSLEEFNVVLSTEKNNYRYLEITGKEGFLKGVFAKLELKKYLAEFNKAYKKDLSKTDFKKLIDIISRTEEESLKNYIENKKYENLLRAKELIGEKEKFFDGIMKNDNFVEYARTNLFKMNYELYISCLNYMNQEVLKHKEKVIKAVTYFIADNQYQYIVDNYGYKEENHEEFLRFLSMAYPVQTTTLAAISGVLSTIKVSEPFRTIMADEAGMIASHSIVEALNRAKRAIIVGDPKQLSPIVQVSDIFLSDLRSRVSDNFWNTYSPTKTSAFHRAAGTIEGGYKATGRGIVLDEHRRCAKKIANIFIDIAEYKGLKVCTYTPKTKPLKLIGDNLFFFHTKNNDTTSYKKINFNEIEKIDSILKRLESIGYDLKSEVGIITPYKDQERELINRFAARLGHSGFSEAKIGTVHKFQGVEYKVIIFSTVVSRVQDTLSFINVDPSMINVAVSRAKEVFIAVGDFEKLTEDSSYSNFAGRMAKLIKKNGKFVFGQKLNNAA